MRGGYTNVNTFDDVNMATYIYRSIELKKFKVSLIIPAYNEEASIGHVIDEFKNDVDEILVVENCSDDRTAQIAKDKGVRVISMKLKGYGDA